MTLSATKRPTPQDLHLLATDTDLFLRQVWIPKASNIRFQVEGVFYQARYQPDGEGVRLQIWAELGYLPFSLESAQRRRMLITILEGTAILKETQFGLTEKKQIIVTRTFNVPNIQPPGFIFISLIAFLQEARPFLKLIAECM